jgi:Flp pilus assembly pilin Flp
MILKIVSKCLSLEPKANPIEYGIIFAIVATALLSTLLAATDSLANYYDILMGGGRPPQ